MHRCSEVRKGRHFSAVNGIFAQVNSLCFSKGGAATICVQLIQQDRREEEEVRCGGNGERERSLMQEGFVQPCMSEDQSVKAIDDAC